MMAEQDKGTLKEEGIGQQCWLQGTQKEGTKQDAAATIVLLNTRVR